jgi:hypothetical protein
MVHYEHSYRFGKAQELRVTPVINNFFNRTITPTTERYDRFDYKCDQFNYEMKSRTCKKDAYPDTMITCNKLEQSDKPIILLFNFTDKLCYIEHDPILFKGFRTILFSRAMEDSDKKEHIFIPLKHLKDICDWDKNIPL